MSYELRIWEQPAGQPAPTSLRDAGQLMQALETRPSGVNPKLVALGREMAQRYPVRAPGGPADDAVWPSDPVAEAQALTRAVWPVAIPDDDRVRVVHFVVERATALGLTVFDDQLGMAFLPSGQVLPAEKAEIWAGLTRELAQEQKPFTKADFRKMMSTFVNETVAPHGFVARKSTLADVEFVRPTPDGSQMILMQFKGSAPRWETVVSCQHRNEAAEAVFETLFGVYPATPGTFYFNLGAFRGEQTNGFEVAGSADIRGWMALLNDQAMPVLDMARTLAGLDRVMNEPGLYPLAVQPERLDPPSLDAFFRTRAVKRSFKPLIVAWMLRNPRFDAMVAQQREFVRRRVDVSEADLDRLLAHLRTHVRQAS